MSNAKNFMCDMLYKPTDAIYAENIRQFQGCPTIAITKGGRIYMGWYSGGRCEPHIENYNILVYSDDNGKTWSAPLLIIPSCKERLVQALDIQLWISPEGKLYVFWVQNNVVVDDGITKGHAIIDGYIFNDTVHAAWLSVCDDPELLSCVGFEGGSFRDCTRVAALDVPLWTQLFTLNGAALTDTLERLEGRLRAYREAIACGDTQLLSAMLASAAGRKRQMNLEQARGDDIRMGF